MFLPASAETAAFNARLEQTLETMPHLTTMEPHEARASREAGESIFGVLAVSPLAYEMPIPGPAGDLTVRVFPAENPTGVYLHIHGGGWVLGAPHHQDPRLEALSAGADVTVVSVGYRLAPEHRHPSAPDDCEAAALWLTGNAAREFGSDKLVIGGESAGAHLAVVTLTRMRDRHGFRGFSGANLLYGIYDLRMTPGLRAWGDRNLIVDTGAMGWFIDHYLGDHSRDDPDVSPFLAEISGLPPALFTVGTEDPLLEDSLFMHARWGAAGNVSQLDVYPGGCHAFDAFPLAIADEASERIRRFFLDVLA